MATAVGVFVVGVSTLSEGGVPFGGLGISAAASDSSGLADSPSDTSTQVELASRSAEPAGSGAGTPLPAYSEGSRFVDGWHVPVLMYHHVGAGSEVGDALPGLVVPPALFAAQMGLLRAQGWRTITAAELATDVEKAVHPPPKTFVVTFDDGFQDGYTEAYPILRRDGFVATYFVVTGRIGQGVDMTSAALQALAAGGMEIADHTIDHLPLAAMPSPVAWDEIVFAAAWIASLLGAPPTTFAYPFGSRDAEVVADVARAGFLMAFTNREGCLESTATRLIVPRIRVNPSTTPAELLHILGRCSYP